MTDPLPGKRYGAIQAWPEAADPAPGVRWRYLPFAPAPQRNPAGKPQVTMIDAGGVLMLTVGANLAADEPALAAARAQIAAETGLAAQAIELRPAEIAIRRAVLELAPATGAPRQLALASPSPVAPYPSAFSAVLQGDAAAEAKAALASGDGRIRVRYEIDLPAERERDGPRRGRVDRRGRRRVPCSSSGKLAFAVEADAGASDRLVAATRAEAAKSAQEAIARMATGAVAGAPVHRGPAAVSRRGVAASVTRSETAGRSLDLTADVEDWI